MRSLVASAIRMAAGVAVSARNVVASSSEGFVTNCADSGLCATKPGSGSHRMPAVAVIRTTQHSSVAGTPARLAAFVKVTLSPTGMLANT